MDELASLSQASAHFPLEPVSGATLFDQETTRRDALKRRRTCLTGCSELDDEVLLGGFERGCVVGISAEEEEMGLLIGLQTIANLFVASLESGAEARPRVVIITTLSMGALLPMLRDALGVQLVARGEKSGDANNTQVTQFLESISISRVFDVPGLWEVLGELDSLASHGETHGEPPSSQPEEVMTSSEEVAKLQPTPKDDGKEERDTTEASELSSSPLSDPPSSLSDVPPWETASPVRTPPVRTPPGQRTEIADSEEEECFPSPPSPHRTSQPKAAPVKASEAVLEDKPAVHQPSKWEDSEDSTRPDIILITHMSSLLSSLFHQRERTAAHQTVQLLSSHLHYVTRCPNHGGPLVMILNSTTTSSPDANITTKANTTLQDRNGPSSPPPPPPPPAGAPNPPKTTNKPLDPTLRSIFNPPPLPVTGLSYAYGTLLSRRNKPSFGLIFTQLLDEHLLCTRVPRTRADAEALYAPPSRVSPASAKAVEYAWVVECLLDEVGVWEGAGVGVGVGGGERRIRRSREQRWGAVDIRRDEGAGVRIVNAFGKREKNLAEIRLAAGFGGRRV